MAKVEITLAYLPEVGILLVLVVFLVLNVMWTLISSGKISKPINIEVKVTRTGIDPM